MGIREISSNIGKEIFVEFLPIFSMTVTLIFTKKLIQANTYSTIIIKSGASPSGCTHWVSF